MSTSKRLDRRSRVPLAATLSVGIGLWTLLVLIPLWPTLLFNFTAPPGLFVRILLGQWLPGVVWTLVIPSWSARFVRQEWRGARFWRGGAGIVLVPALTHAILHVVVMQDVMLTPVPLAWYGHVIFFLLFTGIYGLTVAVAIVLTQRELAQTRQRELRDTQLRALRARLQPHFLFNTLHAVSVTCRNDAEAATRMLALLGDLLRQTLRERDGRFVALAEERDLLQPYLELQRLRFPDRLRFELDLPDDVLRAAVPDLLLQPLVENAVLHGIEQRLEGGTVRIVARRQGERLEIRIEDDGAGLREEAVGREGDGIGLGTTRDRLQALFGARATVGLVARSGGGTVATLVMPFREVADAA